MLDDWRGEHFIRTIKPAQQKRENTCKAPGCFSQLAVNNKIGYCKAHRHLHAIEERRKKEARLGGEVRPVDCRFRLKEDGAPYDPHRCTACGRNTHTDANLGLACYLED